MIALGFASESPLEPYLASVVIKIAEERWLIEAAIEANQSGTCTGIYLRFSKMELKGPY